MIQKAAAQAAEKDVEVRVEYHEFGFDGTIDAVVVATPKAKK